jgi:RHS repeat-associated protein
MHSLRNDDNGNVYGITHYGHQTRNQTFTYDALSRLTSAQNAGTDCTVILPDGHTEYWGNSYSYDAWGNLLGKAPTKCSAENLSVSAAANNQLQGGYAYDAAGNMMHDATANLNYTYDQENRIAGAAGFTYTYDADGNRVEKANGTRGTLYWYMSLGIVGESDLLGNLKSEYIFFDGERVARKDFPGNAVAYYLSDHLKTASVITDSAGNIKSESDYYPWGGELQFANNDSNRYKFTGKERDLETGLDYFGARYYSNGLGRFITPDWAAKAAAVPYADFADPQSLNLYTYVRNIPTSKVDADGHDTLGDIMYAGIVISAHYVGNAVVDTVSSVGHWLTSGPPPHPPVPGSSANPCLCLAPPAQNNNNKNDNNSNQQSSTSSQSGQGKSTQGGKSGMAPKEGETGGPGAGKRIPPKTQGQALEENKAANGGQAKCVFCKEDVGEGTDNKVNFDHAKAKANNGNNSLNNTNIACEYCNKSKGAGDVPKNPKQPD